MTSSSVATSECSFSTRTSDDYDMDDEENHVNVEFNRTLSSPIQQSMSLPLQGAHIPNGQNFWDFYNPIPTRIVRPTTTKTPNDNNNGNDDQEEEEEEEDSSWTDFCNRVDAILVPLNQSRQLLFAMLTLSLFLAILLLVGMFFHSCASDCDASVQLGIVVYIVFGCSILLPILLLIMTRYLIPIRIKTFQQQMKRLCKQEQARRRGGTSICMIQFVQDCDGKGCYYHHALVTVPENNDM